MKTIYSVSFNIYSVKREFDGNYNVIYFEDLDSAHNFLNSLYTYIGNEYKDEDITRKSFKKTQYSLSTKSGVLYLSTIKKVELIETEDNIEKEVNEAKKILDKVKKVNNFK